MFPCHTSNIPITLNNHLNQRYSFTIKYVCIPLLASIPKFSKNLPRASGAIANVGIILPFIRAWPFTFPIIRECFKSWVKDGYRLVQGFFKNIPLFSFMFFSFFPYNSEVFPHQPRVLILVKTNLKMKSKCEKFSGILRKTGIH